MRTPSVSSRFAMLSLVLLSLGSCTGAKSTEDDTPPPLGDPITAMTKTWTWIDFPDSQCDDGSPTGIGLNLSDTSQDLLVFLMGGGACWDYDSCAVSNTSTHGPFGSKEFNSQKGIFALGSILSRNTKTPFKDYNMVFVPYCTGDVHIGDKITTYTDGMGTNKEIHHKGRANLVAFLTRLAATVRTPGKLVVSGSSAGGFGAALNYDLFRKYFPSAKSYLIDDSGPPMIGNAIPADLHAKWYDAWGLDGTLSPLCPDCKTDFSALVPILAQKYPADRMALLSNNRDQVIRSFFGMQSEMDFQTNLYAMADQVITPQPNFRYFFTDGTGHTFLFLPAFAMSGGVKLIDWINQMGNDDPQWTSIKP